MSQTGAPEHPAPQRHRVRPPRLLVSAAAGPVGWIVQLLATYGLSSRACAEARRLGAGGAGLLDGQDVRLVAINLACLLAVGVGGAFSYRYWRRTRREKQGDVHDALMTGEGRTRFIAACGTLSAVGFAIAILFNTLEPLMVPACWTGAG